MLITGASSGIGRATALKVGDAGGKVILVARASRSWSRPKDEIDDVGGVAYVHRCDLADIEDIERMAKEVLAEHGRVDILVNNAGRSIRRSIALSYDRFHDYERTMQLNYFGAAAADPGAAAGDARPRKRGHIINISSIGVQTNTPRFSAYVASKAALDAFCACIASECQDDNVHLTTIHMPLVRTPMIAPTRMYDRFPTMTPEEAADMICKAMISKPKKVATTLGNVGELLYEVAPKASDTILNTGYKLFPDSQAAKGKGEEAARKGALDRGGRLRAPDERRALVARPAGVLSGHLQSLVFAARTGARPPAPRARWPSKRLASGRVEADDRAAPQALGLGL